MTVVARGPARGMSATGTAVCGASSRTAPFVVAVLDEPERDQFERVDQVGILRIADGFDQAVESDCPENGGAAAGGVGRTVFGKRQEARPAFDVRVDMLAG